MVLSPNPVKDVLQLNLGNMNDESVEVLVLSCTRASVTNYVLTKDWMKLDVSDLPSGVCVCGEVTSEYFKFLKELKN